MSTKTSFVDTVNNALVITYGIPATFTFKFNIVQDNNNTQVPVIIPLTDKVIVKIKSDLRLTTSVLEYVFTDVTDNTITIDITAEQAASLRGGATYVLGIYETDSHDTPVRGLVRDMPLVVQESVLL